MLTKQENTKMCLKGEENLTTLKEETSGETKTQIGNPSSSGWPKGKEKRVFIEITKKAFLNKLLDWPSTTELVRLGVQKGYTHY